MCKWQIEASATSKANPESVWKLWSDVPSWNQWDSGVESSRIHGKFSSGVEGRIKPKGWSESTFAITLAKKNERFITLGKMPFTSMTFDHIITPLPKGQILITHRATVSGLLAGLLYFTLRGQLKRSLTDATKNLASLAKKKTR